MTRRTIHTLIALLAGASLAGQISSANAQSDYPSEPITYVVQAGAGGSSDGFVRMLTGIMSEKGIVPVNFIVENLPGANGALAFTRVAQAEGNPYVLGNSVFATVATAITTGTYSLDDFTPIARLASEPNSLVTATNSGLESIDAIVAAAKARPGEVRWAAGNVGSNSHLMYVQFQNLTETEITYIPFGSDAEAVAAVLGGHAEIASVEARTVSEHVRAGTLAVLGVAGDERGATVPDVPTFREQGYDIISQEIRGVVAPAGIPEEARAYLEAAFLRASEDPTWQEFLANNGITPGWLNSADYAAYLNAENERLSVLLKEVGLAN